MVDSRKLIVSFFIVSVVSLAVLSRYVSGRRSGSELVEPAELAQELSDPKHPKPTILYVGPSSCIPVGTSLEQYSTARPGSRADSGR